MTYPLNLKISISQPVKDFERQKTLKELKAIKDFEKQIEFYNEKITSLAFYRQRLMLKGEEKNEPYIIYCRCKNCNDKYTIEQHEIVRQKEQNEIKRIVEFVNSKDNYYNKLNAFLSVKGASFDRSLTILDSFEKPPILSVEPSNKNEIEIFNKIAHAKFNDSLLKNGVSKQGWNFFEVNKEIERLKVSLSNAFDKKTLLNDIKNKIEKHFNYKQPKPARVTNSNLWFAKLMQGVPIDINKKRCSTKDFVYLFQAKSIFEYYKFVVNELNNKEQTKILPLPPTAPVEGSELKFTFDTTKLWNSTPINVIIENLEPLYTGQLVKEKDFLSKNGNPFLTKQQFYNFINRAFNNATNIEKPKFNYVDSEKGMIIKCFFELYQKAKVEYKSGREKAPFINLIVDNFDNGWKFSDVKALFR